MQEPSIIKRLIAEARIDDSVSREWLQRAANELQNLTAIERQDEEELLLLDKKGQPNGLSAPRWLCHLIGLRHGTVHVLLWSPQIVPRMLLQVRSAKKKEYPEHLDLSATGHAGIENDWVASACRELHEETGISAKDLCGGLIFVGANFQVYEDDNRNFHDYEYVRIYTQKLRPLGLASLRPGKEEVDRILFVMENSINSLLKRWKAAPGLKSTLPVYMSWLQKNRKRLLK